MVLRYIQVCTYIYNSSILPLTFASLPFPPIISKKTFHPSSLSSLSTLLSLIHPSINYDLAIKSAQTSYYVFQKNLQYLFPHIPLHPISPLLPSPLSPPLPFPSPFLPAKYKYVKKKRKIKVKINILPSACPHLQFRPPYIGPLTSGSKANAVQS